MDILRSGNVTARKNHICDWCGCIIPKGSVYENQVIKGDGFYQWKAHMECVQAFSILCMAEYDDGDGIDRETFLMYLEDTGALNWDEPIYEQICSLVAGLQPDKESS